MPRKSNSAGLDIIKYYEDLKLKAYRDTKGLLTIGWGHRGSDVVENQVITKQVADMLLEHDVEWAETVVNTVKTRLNDNQFSAIVSFVYNVGSGKFNTSTLLKCLNRGDFKAAADEIVKWFHTAGSENGLLARRKAEQDLFNKPVVE